MRTAALRKMTTNHTKFLPYIMIIVRVWNALYGNAVRWNRNTRHIFNLLLPILEEAGHTVKDYTLH